MSEELLQKLQFLEEDYLSQPPAVQQTDLQEINKIRSRLGMPLVDAQLRQIGAPVEEEVEEEPQPEPEEVPDHSEAQEIYKAYLKKKEELELHQAYADKVAKATAGAGMTPVRPLAVMGTDGGALLCDYCKKPIVLEGGNYHGVTADVAWKRTKNPPDNWRSYILGGMVVEIETNGTLRIYHGYPGHGSNYCCNIAAREDEQARSEFDASKRIQKRPMVSAFVEAEFPEMTREERLVLVNDILDTMYKYDPGIGVNRPSKKN